jgi:fido (protein-threonine AMPylation protein)
VRQIVEAEEWAFRQQRNVLSEQFLKELHKRMFGKVWRWAGKFRLSERNISPHFMLQTDTNSRC